MQKLIANKQQYYAGVTVEENEEFEASDGDAHLLCIAGAAHRKDDADPLEYHRRDMQAVDSHRLSRKERRSAALKAAVVQ
jgi:hypothetical protein